MIEKYNKYDISYNVLQPEATEITVPNFKKYITDQADALQQRQLGRKLEDSPTIPRPFQHYSRQLNEDEQLYMLLSGGYVPELIVVNVTERSEYDLFYNEYYSGMYSDIALYAVPNDLVQL